MRNYKEIFLKHDKERFENYLENVKQGKETIAAGSLQDGDSGEVAILQWQRMVDDLSVKGELKNSLAICDVSGSMYGSPFCDVPYGFPLNVSVALGLLISDLSEEPWKGKLVTLSNNPQLQKIEGDDLRSKIKSIKMMDWEMNTVGVKRFCFNKNSIPAMFQPLLQQVCNILPIQLLTEYQAKHHS